MFLFGISRQKICRRLAGIAWCR